MVKEELQVNKTRGSENPILQSIDQILNVDLNSGFNFRAKLIDVRGKSLLFERKDGTRLIVNRDSIAFATEIINRQRR